MRVKTTLFAFCLTSLVGGLLTGAEAHHNKGSHAPARGGFAGIFEAPFVANGGAEVPNSEGKIGSNGAYKVELMTGIANTTFEICLEDVSGVVPLQSATSDAEGELNVQDNLFNTVFDPVVNPVVNLQAPRLQVRIGGCGGTLLWESGLTVTAP